MYFNFVINRITYQTGLLKGPKQSIFGYIDSNIAEKTEELTDINDKDKEMFFLLVGSISNIIYLAINPNAK
ncbi:hypothetical protein C2G38_2229656 [Gigaspora rosea]|uniref:Uncharacterized protein n=1 Tax=Gigaspora rosea TaxID=44941 RepID=A0A397TYA7_9GLOM|nr:hypothetical protein C2G38_2229656 [Gigaspora rosea]